MKLGTLGRVVAGIALAATTFAATVAPWEAQVELRVRVRQRARHRTCAPRATSRPTTTIRWWRRSRRSPTARTGRIGIAAIDLFDRGRRSSILGDQPFPMASTSKIAIAAAYLEGVDQGRWSLNY